MKFESYESDADDATGCTIHIAPGCVTFIIIIIAVITLISIF